jgi:heme exporter protein D
VAVPIATVAIAVLAVAVATRRRAVFPEVDDHRGRGGPSWQAGDAARGSSPRRGPP